MGAGADGAKAGPGRRGEKASTNEGESMERSTERKRRVFQRPADIVEDSYFDSLAASVQEHLQRGVKTLVITSSGAGEGKSTITAGLARALARPGRLSVCIV